VWLDGRRLDGDLARVIRRVVRDAVVAAIDEEAAFVSPQFLREVFGQDTDIVIEASAGRGTPSKDHFQVHLGRTTDVAELFQGILTMQRRGTWEIDNGAGTLVAFLALVDTEAARLRTFIRQRLEERRADHDAAVALLALSGLMAGKGSPGDPRGLLVAAM